MSSTSHQQAKLTGHVRYNQYSEHIELPPDCRVEVVLADVSLQDVAAKIVSKQTIESPTEHPISYCLNYDPSAIDERYSYAVSAKILSSDGRLLWINTTSHHVLTRGFPRDHVEIEVEHVAR